MHQPFSQLATLRRMQSLAEHVQRQRDILASGVDLSGRPLSDGARAWIVDSILIGETKLLAMKRDSHDASVSD